MGCVYRIRKRGAAAGTGRLKINREAEGKVHFPPENATKPFGASSNYQKANEEE